MPRATYLIAPYFSALSALNALSALLSRFKTFLGTANSSVFMRVERKSCIFLRWLNSFTKM